MNFKLLSVFEETGDRNWTRSWPHPQATMINSKRLSQNQTNMQIPGAL